MASTTSSFEILLDEFLSNKNLFYKNVLKTNELQNLFLEEVNKEQKKIIYTLKEKLESHGFDFYLSLMLITSYYKFGDIESGDSALVKVTNLLFRLKKYQRVIELLDFLQRQNISNNLCSHILEKAKITIGEVSVDSINEEELSILDFNEVRLNSSVYLSNEEILKKFVTYGEVYPLGEVLEAILKSLPVIELNGSFVKICSEVAKSTGSQYIANEVMNVVCAHGQSFGINLNEMKSVELTDEMNERKENDTDEQNLEYRHPISFDESREKKQTSYSNYFEKAKDEKDSGDFISALATYREAIHNLELDSDLYKNMVYEIADCYYKLGNRKTSKKLYSYLMRKDPRFRRVKERLEEIE